MKKKPVPSEAATQAPSEKKSGPEKEKVQITVRADKVIMDEVYALMNDANTRITDLVERGLVLVLAEEDRLPRLTSQVRFLVANATKDEQEQLRDYLTFLRADEVRKPSEVDKVNRQFIRAYLKTFVSLRKQVHDLYSRYRAVDEVEKAVG